MANPIKIVVAKDAQFGIYGKVAGWQLYLEKDNLGRIVDSKCVSETDKQLVFECDPDKLTEVLDSIAGHKCHMKYIGSRGAHGIYRCSECGAEDIEKGRFCRNCRAEVTNG